MAAILTLICAWRPESSARRDERRWRGLNLPNTTGPGPSSLGIFQTENQIPISANGQRISSNSYMIDGVSVNSQTWGGAAVVTPNIDAVQEINVTTQQLLGPRQSQLRSDREGGDQERNQPISW